MVKKLFIIIFFLGVFFAAASSKVFAQELGQIVCSSAIPVVSPNLYKVDTTHTSATIFFTAPQDTITAYTVSYGLTQDATGYTTQFVESPQNGNIIFTLSNLLPDATYFFKVRSENNCAHGPWSAIRESNYPFSIGPRLPTTGQTNYFLWIGLAGAVSTFVGIAVFIL